MYISAIVQYIMSYLPAVFPRQSLKMSSLCMCVSVCYCSS